MAWPGLGAGGNSALGIVLVIAACISYGFAVNLARPLQQRNGALPVVWRALLVALILTAPLGLPRGAARPLDAARRCCRCSRSARWAPASPT